MTSVVFKAILLLALPFVIFIIGATLMGRSAGRDYVTQQLGASADPGDRKPLNQRITGYSMREVSHHWGALDAKARANEGRFLELDLVFPFFYGAGFASALLLAWAALGRPFQPAWLILPVALTVVSDWTENLVQLYQLQRFAEHGVPGLQAGWVRLASIATVVKLASILAASLLLVWLTMWIIARTAHPS